MTRTRRHVDICNIITIHLSLNNTSLIYKYQSPKIYVYKMFIMLIAISTKIFAIKYIKKPCKAYYSKLT